MDLNHELPVVYENGVLKPEGRLDFPERTRLMALLRPVAAPSGSAAVFAAKLHELRTRAGVRTSGWRFDRDELYDRS